MATIKNPFNKFANIDLLPTLNSLVPAYGLLSESNLFKETGVKTNQAMFGIVESDNPRMTKLTSRTERDAVKVSGKREKQVTVGGSTIKLTGGLHVEDLMNRINTGSDEAVEESVREVLAERTKLTYDSFSQSFEYMLLTASQGRMRDPNDGTVVTDMFTATGTTQSTATVDASAGSTTLLSDLNAIRNQLSALNGGQGVVGQIELWVADDVMSAISTHPDFIQVAQLAYQGRGAEAMGNPLFTGFGGNYVQGKYGYYREFRFENFVFRTYPQAFTAMNGSVLQAIANGKGWTVVRGAADVYNVLYAPAPYISQLGGVGSKIHARTTGIVDDTHLDFTIESHLNPFMKRPELALDITFTI